MKIINKNKIFIIFFVLLFFSLYSCATNKIWVVEKAVNAAGKDILEKINKNSNIAVISNFSLPTDVNDQIIMWLENYLLKHGNFRIVSRQRIDILLNELNFGFSGFISDEAMLSIGKMLGAAYITVGDIKTIKNKVYLNIQVLETETAVLVYSGSFRIKHMGKNDLEKQKLPFRF